MQDENPYPDPEAWEAAKALSDRLRGPTVSVLDRKFRDREVVFVRGAVHVAQDPIPKTARPAALAAPRERRDRRASSPSRAGPDDDSDESEPPPRRLCENKRCAADLSHRPKADYRDSACKQQTYRDRQTAGYLDDLVGTIAEGISCECDPPGNLVIEGVCFPCGRPRGEVTREWLDDQGVPARSFVVTPSSTDAWRTRPDRELSTKLRRTRGRWDKPAAREEVAA